MKIQMHENILQANDRYAEKNRSFFREHGVLVVNMIASPGAGKTSMIERLLEISNGNPGIAVIEGDLATAQDANRILNCGGQAVQINTDGGCHLDAKMISKVLPAFEFDKVDLLLIENVGNLVCPSSFDLGEDLRIVVLSSSEGDDKPSKYPATFAAADIAVLNKTDLIPYVDFSSERAERDIRTLNPNARVFPVCCKPDACSGISELLAYLSEKAAEKRQEGFR